MKLSIAAVAVLPGLLAASAAVAGDPCAAPDTQSKASQALSLAQQKKYADAEGPAKAALGVCATQPTATQALGQALVAQKKYDEAVSRMSGVLGAKPDVAYAYLWRGYAYYYKKQTDKMVSDFQTFVKLAPSAPEAPTVKQLLASLK